MEVQMAAQRLSMRKIREILRLKHESGLSARKIAESCSVGRTTVSEYLSRAAAAGLDWPLPPWLDDSRLEQLLFPPPPPPDLIRPLPIWAEVHLELRKKGVTLALLWEEYKAAYPDGYQYSQFCELYRRWRGKLSLWMRQDHKAGEKLFVDYAGQTVGMVDPHTGEIKEAQIFVAVLGASSYTFAEATWTQGLPDWIGSHLRAFSFFGGVPELLVPDNLKSGVYRACRYEPGINLTYQEMAAHYGTAVLPARVKKPKDKAKVEAGVLLVERWILARLRKRTFFSLDELNQAIAELLQQLNRRPFKKIQGSRKELFQRLDRPALRPLPPVSYQYAEWSKAKVNMDYHLEVGRHYYSAPYQLVGKRLDIRITARTVECFFKGKRVASHRRSFKQGRHTTLDGHMPRAHREHLKWTPERLLNWAAKTGPATEELARVIMQSRAHPQQGFRSVLGIMRLTKAHGDHRVEAACRRALAINAKSFKSVQSILKNGLDRKPAEGKRPEINPINHQNIRGAAYYAPRKEEQIADPPHHGKADRDEADRHGQGHGRANGDERYQFPLL
jgi:transposase